MLYQILSNSLGLYWFLINQSRTSSFIFKRTQRSVFLKDFLPSQYKRIQWTECLESSNTYIFNGMHMLSKCNDQFSNQELLYRKTISRTGCR